MAKFDDDELKYLADERLLKLENETHNSRVQFWLGKYYKNPLNNNIDDWKPELSQEWFKKAAAQGDVDAVLELSEIDFTEMEGVNEEVLKAEGVLDILKRAAENSNAAAMAALGLCFYNGWNVEKNKESAVEWLNKACDGGFRPAAEFLLKIYEEAEVEDEKDGSSDLCLKYASKAAELDSAEGYYYLACYYEAKKNYEEASYYYRQAIEAGDEGAYEYWLELMEIYAENDDVSAMCDYADHLYNVELDYDKAIEWYKKAVEKGSEQAKYCLGFCYREGCGVEQSLEKAFELYKEAAEQGYGEALLDLGVWYRNGIFVEENDAAGFEYYKKAAEKKNCYAMYYLGMSYRHGYGVEKDYTQAV